MPHHVYGFVQVPRNVRAREKRASTRGTHAPDTSHHLRPNARIASISTNTKSEAHFCSPPVGHLKGGPALIKVCADKFVRKEYPDVFIR